MNCPACIDSPMETQLICVQPNRELEAEPIKYRRCRTCGLVTRTPLPERNALRAYYEKAWQFSEPRPATCFWSAADFIRGRIDKFSSGSAIDVGSKGGALLEAIGQYLPETWTFHNLDAQPGPQQAWLGEGYTSEARHDLTMATHVLEHAIDPVQFMRDLVGMTTVGGHIYIEVPSIEVGHEDVSTGDDLNPNHIWHFSLTSLCLIASSLDVTVAAAESDSSVVGWPCNRLLLRNRSPDGLRKASDNMEREYCLAILKIDSEWQEGDALYGASNSCWKLLANLGKVPVFDLHRNGSIRGIQIRNSLLLRADGIKRVWVTPRFWNSQVEIRQWLNMNFPGVEVLCPYESMPL